jgi:putative flippase GtrA
VGATGYAVNLWVFAVCLHLLGIDYHLAAVIAFVVSVINNFWWNRHWTFDASHDHALFQGARFFAVSLVAFGFQYAMLVLLVSDAGMSKVLAQAIAIASATPLSFLGQKLWSFKA